MKKPSEAILDGDIIAWKAAFVAEVEGSLAIDSLISRIVDKWTPSCVSSIKVALSCSKKDNFRRHLFPGYKKNREAAYRPDCLLETFEALRDTFDCLVYPKLEADDVLGIFASSGKGISVTIDKDLKGVSGWLYNPEKNDEPYYISPEDAERWFCTQWMSGDSTDGLPGLWRIGKKTAEKLLDEWDEENWHANIAEMYSEGKHVPKNDYEIENLCKIMGQCVRILHKENYNLKTEEITYWEPKVGV